MSKPRHRPLNSVTNFPLFMGRGAALVNILVLRALRQSIPPCLSALRVHFFSEHGDSAERNTNSDSEATPLFGVVVKTSMSCME